MLKIVSLLLVLVVALASSQSTTPAPPVMDLCVLQSKIDEAIGGFSPDGQKAARTIFLDVQHELSTIIQKYYGLVKTQNAATLAKLKATEGDKLTTFLNSIGFNNATAFSGDKVDLCQVQTSMKSSYTQLQPSSQATIVKVAKYYMGQAKPDLANIAKTIMNKDQGLIFQLYKTEKMDKLMALANVMQSAMSVNY